MPFRSRNIVSEIATAIAVLALYVLVLLAPLHQAAGLQRDFDALGYSSLDLWSICIPNTRDDGSKPLEIAKCPVAGIGKHDVTLSAPPSLDLAAPSIATRIVHRPAPSPIHPPRPPNIGQPRAPPATV